MIQLLQKMQKKLSVSEYINPVSNNFVNEKSQRLVFLYKLQESAIFPFELMAKLPENFKVIQTQVNES